MTLVIPLRPQIMRIRQKQQEGLWFGSAQRVFALILLGIQKNGSAKIWGKTSVSWRSLLSQPTQPNPTQPKPSQAKPQGAQKPLNRVRPNGLPDCSGCCVVGFVCPFLGVNVSRASFVKTQEERYVMRQPQPLLHPLVERVSHWLPGWERKEPDHLWRSRVLSLG